MRLELTDQIRVTIAAQACLLLLHRGTDYYPELTSILVYPCTSIAEEGGPDGADIWAPGSANPPGAEARRMGSLVLAGDEVKHGAADPADGHNPVVHQFAHSWISKTRAVTARPRWGRARNTSLGRA
ncbi:hypothetical protein BH20VER1_BH20VER1_04920 [soil metagenome]